MLLDIWRKITSIIDSFLTGILKDKIFCEFSGSKVNSFPLLVHWLWSALSSFSSKLYAKGNIRGVKTEDQIRDWIVELYSYRWREFEEHETWEEMESVWLREASFRLQCVHKLFLVQTKHEHLLCPHVKRTNRIKTIMTSNTKNPKNTSNEIKWKKKDAKWIQSGEWGSSATMTGDLRPFGNLSVFINRFWISCFCCEGIGMSYYDIK